MRPIQSIIKRDGSIVPYERVKISNAITKAAKAVNSEHERQWAERLAQGVETLVIERFGKNGHRPHVEHIQDIVERVLIEAGEVEISKAYILYREKRSQVRSTKKLLLDGMKLVDDYLQRSDWRVNENANMNYSLQGLNYHVASSIAARYWLQKIYPPEVQQAHVEGALHIHDLGVLAAYCCGWDLQELLLQGFGGVSAKIESKPPRHLRSALGQSINFLYTLQGETAGAQAFSNFDTLLAPFVRSDGLSYTGVKQAIQEFIFNINVPTRVGFQCLSEDTDILTPEGWKSYDDIKVGDTIKTFNVQTGMVEDQPVLQLFARHYSGSMYRLRNRIQDQLISPGHRVIRKKFNTDGEFILEEVEQVATYKSPVIVPISGLNGKPPKAISDDEIQLLAWIIADGTKESYTKHRHSHRISIYQSQTTNPDEYAQIIGLLDRLNLTYSVRDSTPALGQAVSMIRLNAESSHRVLDTLFGTRESIKFIPGVLKNMDKRQARLFLDTYLKADGHEGCKITTSDTEILNGLQQIAVDAEYGFTVGTRKPTIGKKPLHILRLIDHQDTYIQHIGTVDYSGVIWCPTTSNQTVVARRKGKVVITGNTPFTNLTMDLIPPTTLRDMPVMIGGEPQEDTYGDFQHEMDMINRAFAEVMLEGDAKSRVFTFPIPTYNIFKEFDWDNPTLEPVWKMTAKYGIPYFANFVNSDMKPEDARSMCCRLRLDNRELRKRGGGLFAANPLTGSIGVVTLNMSRIGYLAESENHFWTLLESAMRLAQTSLEIKRKVLEQFTNDGLYPYSRHFLTAIKQRLGSYWANHFSTIAINGMNECCLNLLGVSIAHREGLEFAERVLLHMRESIREIQIETGHLYNLEAAPAESASYRLAKEDRKRFPDIKTSGSDQVPYYTNSTHLPVNCTQDLFEALTHQDNLQVLYTGGTVFHGFLGEQIDDWRQARLLVRRIAENFHMPYFTLTPTFSICPVHGYIPGEHPHCPYEHSEEDLAQFGVSFGSAQDMDVKS